MIKKLESPTDHQWLINYINGLDQTKLWMVKVVPFRRKRSLSQNSLYHLWKAVIADECGYTPNEMHDILRREYLPVKVVKMKKNTHYLLKSTTDLNTKEFTDYLDTIHRDFSANGIILPQPGEQGLEEMYEKYKDNM